MLKDPHGELRILLGVTGSVAAIKAPEIAVRLVEELSKATIPPQNLQVQIRILLTRGGKGFWDKAAEYDPTSWERFESIRKRQKSPIEVYENDDEWKSWKRVGDPVMHIDLRDWADVLLVAPLSAHTLAKFANGLCDDTLSCVARAWNFGPRLMANSDDSAEQTDQYDIRDIKPMILAPAMNTAMWEHPLTQRHLQTIQSFYEDYIIKTKLSKEARSIVINKGVNVVLPQSKKLACGEVGFGALASVETIVESLGIVCCVKDMFELFEVH